VVERFLACVREIAASSACKPARRTAPPRAWGPNGRWVRYGSFATDRGATKIGPCPQCPESDGGRSRCCPSRWAKTWLMQCSKN